MLKALKIKRVLWRLGRSSDEVTDNLIAAGAKGYRHDPQYCPVATYLQEKFNEEAAVMETFVRVGNWRVRPTQAVKQFVREFDSGYRQELNKNGV